MSVLRGNWCGPDHCSRLDSVSSRADRWRQFPNRGEKRHLLDDGRSTASKYSRTTYYPPNATKYFGRSAPITCKPDDLKPGKIIRANYYEEAYDNGSIMPNDKSIIHDPYGKDISKKPRPFIILATHAQSFMCLPIFSFKGKGAKNKPKPEEYVSIRDHRATDIVPAQSIHEPLVTLTMSGPELTPASVVHVTYPVSRNLDTAVTIIGQLTLSSTNHLIRLFLNYMPVEICETSPAPATELSIDAGMSVSRAVGGLRLLEYAHLFGNLSWSNAACLTDNTLKALGVPSPTDRKQILSLFKEVAKASDSGPDWTAKIIL
jgi:hypothetical protein